MITRLSDIIDTGSQAEILAFFITATPRSFSVPELAGRLEISPSSILDSATELEKQNILKTFTKNKTHFFLLNQKHAMIPQLKEYFRREHKQWPDELVSSLKKLGTLSGIFLSGIFVGRPELVVDLLLVGNVHDDQLNQFLKTTSKRFGGELNYSIMSAQEFVMRRDTFDRFIKDIFDYPHIVLLDKSDSPVQHKAIANVVAAPKPVAKPVAKSIAKPKAKLVVQTAPKPVAKKQVKAKARLVVKPVAKPVVKPSPKKVVTKAKQKTVVKKPIVKKAIVKKPIKSKPAAKQVVKQSPKKAAKKVSTKKPVAKKVTTKKSIAKKQVSKKPVVKTKKTKKRI